jgi:hypothetical protein
LFSSDAGLTQLATDNVPASDVFALARPPRDQPALLAATDRGLFASKPGSGIVASASAIKALREQWSREPSPQQLVEAALAYAAIDPQATAGRRTRAGLAALLPRLRVGYQLDVGRSEDPRNYILREGEDLPPGVDTGNGVVEDGEILIAVSQSDGFRHRGTITLQWDLDRLVLNPDALRISRLRPFEQAAERRIVEHVLQAYGARRRLMTETAMRRQGRASSRALLRDQLRIDELTAELDAATDGQFFTLTSVPVSPP